MDTIASLAALAALGMLAVVYLYRRYKFSSDWREKQRSLQSAKQELAAAEERLLKLRQVWGLANERFAAIDTETTGLKPAEARTIQLAIVLFDKGKPNGKRVWLLNPGVRIPPSATKVNRITNEMVLDKPSFKNSASEIKRLLERYPVVAHNLKYDSEVLGADFRRADIKLRLKYGFCTMREEFGSPYSQPEIPPWERTARRKWRKLSDLASQYNVSTIGEFHDAYVDATVAGKCFIEMAQHKISEGELSVHKWRRVLAVCETELALAAEKAAKYSLKNS